MSCAKVLARRGVSPYDRETMMRSMKLAGLLAVGLAAGCDPASVAGGPPQVPLPIVEEQPLPPVTSEPLMWQPGHWDWNGAGDDWAKGQYVWKKGQYVPARGHGNLWMPGWWSRKPSAGWTWQAPGWRS